MAFLDLQRIAAESSEGKAASGKVQALTQKKSAELQEKTKALQSNQQKLQQGGAVLNDAARAQTQKEIDRLTVEIDRFQEDANAEVQELQQSLQAEFQEKLRPVVDAVVKELAIGLLFSAGDAGAIYVDPSLDITGEVIKRFDSGKYSTAAKPAAAPTAKPAATGEARGSRAANGRSPPPPRRHRRRLRPRRRNPRRRAREAVAPRRSRGKGQRAEGKRSRDPCPLAPLPFSPFGYSVPTVSIDIPVLLDRLCYRHPSVLVDAVAEHEPGKRLVAHKNVTINEDFFQGHFPGVPLMPGVLMLETLTQVAAALVLEREGPMPMSRVYLHGVDGAKFRRQVVPGDQLRLEVTLLKARTSLAKARGVAYVGDQIVAEMDLLLAVMPDGVRIHPTAVVMTGAQIGAGTIIGPNAVIGQHVKLGKRCRIGASAVVDGFTEIGDGTEIFPFASIGLIPQDLKFKGEETYLRIGRRNIFREFVTIHRGTQRRRRRDDDRRSQRVHGLRARRARLPHRQRHDLRQQRHARRPCVRRRLRHHQRRVGRPSVLPHRPPRVHRRLFGRHQGRAAVREDRRQSRAHLRPEHDRPDAARVHARGRRQAEARVPVSAARRG